MSDAAKIRPVEIEKTRTLDPDVLAAVIDETARRIEARAARPSPIHLRSWEEIERFAEKAARSGMVPRDYIGRPDAIAIAVQMGSEVGLAPMQSLQNIAVINGRPALWGDAMLGLCKQSAVCKDVLERLEGSGPTLTAVCVALRAGKEPVERRFSMDDAERAGLASKAGTWQQYPARMLQMRARGFALRDAFPDVLKGLISVEEARDIPWEDTGLPPPGPLDLTPLTNPTPKQWLLNLERLLAAAQTAEEVAQIAGHASVGTAMAKASQTVKGRIDELLANANARMHAATQPEPEAPPLGEPEATAYERLQERIAGSDVLQLHRLPTEAAYIAELRECDEGQQSEIEYARVGRIQLLRAGA